MTVAGFTSTIVVRHPDQMRETQTHSTRSARVNRSCCRREHLELMAQGEDFCLEGGSCPERSTEGVKKARRNINRYNAYGLFGRDT
jgi:hypothetical protein